MNQRMKIFISRIWKVVNFITLSLHKVKFQRRTYFYGKLIISIENYLSEETDFPTITIGSDVFFNSGRRYNLIGGNDRTILRTINRGKIYIGNHVGISNAAIVSFHEVRIEDEVFIGGGVKIYDSDFHSINYNDRVVRNDIHAKSAQVRIKRGAFIGGHSIILKGVTVGRKSVIAAGSVVTKNVPDGEIWGGNPARFLKKISG